MQKQIDGIDQRLAGFTHLNQSNTHQDRQQDDLKHDAIRKRADEGVRDDVKKELNGAALLTRGLAVLVDCTGVQRGSVDIHSNAWLCDIDHDEANDQRNG
ncbi:hypothetical protein D3C81_1745000 [compost metagenome]